MSHRLLRSSISTTLVLVGLLTGRPLMAASLHQVIEQAWFAQPEAQSQAEASAAFTARQNLNQAWSPTPASVSIQHSTDRLDLAQGKDGWQTELTLPLWLPGQRQHQQHRLVAEQQAYQQRLSLAHWQLAGRLREAYWQLRIAQNASELAQLRRNRALQLQRDVKTRVHAGELAAIAHNQALAYQQQAQLQLLQNQNLLQQRQYEFAHLSLAAEVPNESETPVDLSHIDLNQHPQLTALQTAVQVAQAHQSEQRAIRRDNPELSATLARERDRYGDAYGNNLSLKLRLPFASDSRYQANLNQASAELLEAEVRLTQGRQQVQTQLAQAEAELRFAEQSLQLTTENYRLNQQSADWQKRAFKLGELDLPAHLAAETQYLDAERAVNTARLERDRAIARVNQAAGVLP